MVASINIEQNDPVSNTFVVWKVKNEYLFASTNTSHSKKATQNVESLHFPSYVLYLDIWLSCVIYYKNWSITLNDMPFTLIWKAISISPYMAIALIHILKIERFIIWYFKDNMYTKFD